MTNRQQQRAAKLTIASMMKGNWTEWEWVNCNHHAAPPKIIKACKNNYYSVQFFQQVTTELGIIDNLMVRRNDAKPVRSWADMQRIKNELCGENRIAVEVYPSEKTLVDQANIYHLWVFPEGFTLPFGLHLNHW